MDQRFFRHPGFLKDIARIRKPAYRMFHQIRVLLCFVQHAVHPLQYAGMDIPCDITFNIDVNSPYGRYLSTNGSAVRLFPDANVQNDNYPMYMFELTNDISTLTGQATRPDAVKSYKDSVLSLINVVPNPYYSYSTYETSSQLETKVRFINVPEGTVVSIYTIDGTMVRRLGPTSGSATTLDWDLHNHTGLPIAGGMYLIHFKVPGIGERVVKWFGTMRPVDLNSYVF